MYIGETRTDDETTNLTITATCLQSSTAVGDGHKFRQFGIWELDFVTDGGAVALASLDLTVDLFKNGEKVFALQGGGRHFEVIDNSLTVYGGRASGVVTDLDTAATAGTDVFVVPDANLAPFAFLESTTAGDANALWQIAENGPYVEVQDNDSPGGDELYIDEDGTGPSKFLTVSTTGTDLFVPCSDGSFILVTHSATAATAGVATHFDDDATNTYERLLFVSPTDADATFTTVGGIDKPYTQPDATTTTVQVLAFL